MTETLYPESEWFKRNLKMLKKSEHPYDYLAGVELCRGKEAAERLAKAAGIRPQLRTHKDNRYPFPRMEVGESRIVGTRATAASVRVSARQYGLRNGVKFATKMLADAVLLIRTS